MKVKADDGIRKVKVEEEGRKQWYWLQFMFLNPFSVNLGNVRD